MAEIDGIYFKMQEGRYHDLARLSASGLQKLLVSPATFWASSWLNSKKTAECDEEVSKAQTLGRAYHTARLEPDMLEHRFVRALEKEDMPNGSLFTGADMASMLDSLGLKKSGSVIEQAGRLSEAGFPDEKLWHCVMADWEAARAGRVAISGRYWDQMQSDIQLIRSTPEIAGLLCNGQAEVSILWTDKSGIKMKCRIDYLQSSSWVDFKTFANPSGKNIQRCISDAFIYNRYHIQAAIYREAVEMIRQGDLQIQGDPSDEHHDLIDAIYNNDLPMECHYVFQEKDGIPNLLAKRLRFDEIPLNTKINNAGASDEARARAEAATVTPSLWLARANREIAKAKRLFRAYSEIYQPGEPWRPFNPISELCDMDFSTFWLDEEISE